MSDPTDPAAAVSGIDEIRITESVDCSTYESAGTQTAMGFSQDPETPGLAENVRRESEVFAESAAMMADAIGATLDRITFDVTFTAATGDSDSLARAPTKAWTYSMRTGQRRADCWRKPRSANSMRAGQDRNGWRRSRRWGPMRTRAFSMSRPG